jgi:radical SAM superfamily enzyme YgiQ (UPF0313 family)
MNAFMGKPKVVLIHPLGRNWLPGQVDMTRLANIMPPHGLMMLAAVLEREGFDCDLVDLYAHPRRLEDLVPDLLARRPDAVGISTTTSSFLGGAAIAAALKERRPDLPVVFGGVHPTSIWARLLKEYPAIDAIVVGEGEETFLELAWAGFKPSSALRGLAYRDAAGHPVFSGPRPLIRDLDALPYPAYHKLEGFPKAYPLPLFNYPKSPSTTFVTSRGCPFSCSYCDRSVFGSTFRFHSAGHLLEHLRFLRMRYGIRHVNIYDDNFLLRKERVVEFCEGLIGSKLGTTFNCIGRASVLDAPLLTLMKRAGCWMINLGVESGDEAVIGPHRARADLEGIREAVRLIHAAGIRAKGLFMLGIPGETESSAEATIRFAVENGFDDANLTKFTPFPGAPIYDTIGEFGEFTEDWEKMNCINLVFVPKGFTRERLEQLYGQFYRRFYGRREMLWKYVSMLWRSPESWWRLLKDLPKFLAARRALEAA